MTQSREAVDLSVVVPTYNRRDRLRRVLDAIDDQHRETRSGRSFRFETIVVSDGSTDGTVEMLDELAPGFPLRVVDQPNGGPAAARNAGIAAACGEIVMFLDDDVVPEPDCLAVHVEHHDTAPDLVVIGLMLSPDDHPMSPWVAWEQHQLEKWYPFFESHPTAAAQHFYTGNASAPRSLLERAGGFDTTFTRAEDIELGYRLEETGCRFVVSHRARGRHYAERSLDSWRNIAHEYGYNSVEFARNGHPERIEDVREDYRAASALRRSALRLLAPSRRARDLTARAAESTARRLDRLGLRAIGRRSLSVAYALRLHGGVADAAGTRRGYRAILSGRVGSRPVVGLVIEQALGHITHGRNLEQLFAEFGDLDTVYLPVDQSLDGVGRFVPGWSNWTVRAGVRARAALRAHERQHADRRFDVLFVHTQVPAVLLGRWLRRIPAIVSLDATPVQYDSLGGSYAHDVGSARAERLKHRLNRRAFDSARLLVTWSRWAKDGLVSDYGVDPDKVTVIPPGVDLRTWRRAEAPRVDGPVRILFVGGDLARKGGELLLAAAERLRADPDVPAFEVHAVTASDVDEQPGVFVHHGLGPNSAELIALYSSADVFCLPTYGDCLPMVLAEAGAMGLPLVSTDVGAISEVVKDGESGVLIPVGDLDALVDGLAVLIRDEHLRAELGAGAHAIVAGAHDARANADRLAQLLRSLAPPTW